MHKQYANIMEHCSLIHKVYINIFSFSHSVGYGASFFSYSIAVAPEDREGIRMGRVESGYNINWVNKVQRAGILIFFKAIRSFCALWWWRLFTCNRIGGLFICPLSMRTEYNAEKFLPRVQNMRHSMERPEGSIWQQVICSKNQRERIRRFTLRY